MKPVHTVSFKHAYEGILYAFTSQPNFRVHIFLSICSIAVGLFLNLNPTEWIILIMTITLGLVIETINTSIEAVVDLITEEWRVNAKRAKDAAAGAMLIYALGATIVAAGLFLPKIIG